MSSIMGIGSDEGSEEKHADENSIKHITRSQTQKVALELLIDDFNVMERADFLD